ncbi:hypothetical protein DPMN_006420 [Dreissena polymorpha]|uniref:Uncharacterized protein n=1 Tax=Dreissena polymorpha TaxID=45954 RepID=A0A9D4RXD4_DREPO|nr:hypothetical protein DPMN_006420 [Dreissena polymorpha]
MNRGSTGMNRGRPEIFNTSGMNLESPVRTGNDRRGTGINLDCTGNNRGGTVVPPGPIQTPAELRQRPGCRRFCPGGAPMNAGRVPV